MSCKVILSVVLVGNLSFLSMGCLSGCSQSEAEIAATSSEKSPYQVGITDHFGSVFVINQREYRLFMNMMDRGASRDQCDYQLKKWRACIYHYTETTPAEGEAIIRISKLYPTMGEYKRTYPIDKEKRAELRKQIEAEWSAIEHQILAL